jgi:hypothetical protein
MKRYRVSVPYACWVTVDVAADSEEEAIEAVLKGEYTAQYCGHCGSNMDIDVSDEPIGGVDYCAIEAIELY